MKKLSIIAALSLDNAIGKCGQLLWRIPEDMRRFRKLTLHKAVIMGRKTYESLPKKPLDLRTNIILSSSDNIDGCLIAHSIDDAISKCPEGESYIIGGASIYRQFIGMADKMYLTQVAEYCPIADSYFPKIDYDDWKLVEREEINSSPHCTFLTYERKKIERITVL